MIVIVHAAMVVTTMVVDEVVGVGVFVVIGCGGGCGFGGCGGVRSVGRRSVDIVIVVVAGIACVVDVDVVVVDVIIGVGIDGVGRTNVDITLAVVDHRPPSAIFLEQIGVADYSQTALRHKISIPLTFEGQFGFVFERIQRQ